MYKFVNDKLTFVYEENFVNIDDNQIMGYVQEVSNGKEDCCPGSYTYKKVTWHLLKYHLQDHLFVCVCKNDTHLAEILNIYYYCTYCKRSYYLSKDWLQELPLNSLN